MRDLLVFAATLVFLALSFRSTYRAYLLWGWFGLISLDEYLYSFMKDIPYVQIFAIITLLSLLAIKDAEKTKFQFNRTSTLFIIFVVHGLFSALLAYPGLVRNWELFSSLTKTVLFCLLMPMLVTSRFRIHVMVVMIAIAISFHGMVDGLKFLASGGNHNARGIAKFGDNNHFAMVLVMVLPLLYYLLQYSARRFIRWGFTSVLVLTTLAVVATGSRGGLVGLLAAGIWVILKSRRRALGITLIALSALLITQLATDRWTSRMETITSAEEDSSFMGRVKAWQVSSAIALSNPVFGGGFRAVQSHPLWDEFKNSPGLLGFANPPQTQSGKAAHSIWFEVLGDRGFLGLLIFVAIIVNAFITRKEILNLVHNDDVSLHWASDLVNILGAAMLAYVVSGSLLSAAYFELPYYLMMLLEVIKLHLQTRTKDSAPKLRTPKYA